MAIITDWPVYRAEKIAAWRKELDGLFALLEKEKDPGKRHDLDAIIESVIMDIDNYECQQASEGH